MGYPFTRSICRRPKGINHSVAPIINKAIIGAIEHILPSSSGVLEPLAVLQGFIIKGVRSLVLQNLV